MILQKKDSPYIQAAPAYDVEEARNYIPLMPQLRDMIDHIPGDDTLTVFGKSMPSETARQLFWQEIRKLSADNHKVSLMMADLRTQSGVSYHSAVPMCAQSTIKAVYAGALIEYRPEALRENRQNLYDAIVFSDNDAYAALRETYGSEPIRRWCIQAGVDPSFAAPLYPRDKTARDMLKMWTRLYCFLNTDTTGFAAYYADSIASATRQQLTLPMQTKAGWEHGLGEERLFEESEIPARFRDGDPLNDECAINDTGIVYTDSGPYLFVIYTDHPFAAVEPDGRGMPNPLGGLVRALYQVQQSMAVRAL